MGCPSSTFSGPETRCLHDIWSVSVGSNPAAHPWPPKCRLRGSLRLPVSGFEPQSAGLRAVNGAGLLHTPHPPQPLLAALELRVWKRRAHTGASPPDGAAFLQLFSLTGPQRPVRGI